MLIRLIFEISSPLDHFETLLLLFFFHLRFHFKDMFKRWTSVPHSTDFFLLVNYLMLLESSFVISRIPDQNEKSYETLFFFLQRPLAASISLRSFSFTCPNWGWLELYKLVWHLVFGWKLGSPDPSKESEKNSEKLNSSKLKTLIPWNGHLKGFLDPLNGLRGRP